MNLDLPIAVSRDEIVRTIHNNRVTIVVAETGSGKTTQIPQYLNAAGYSVVVTQPRRLSARTVSERVAVELGVKLGTTVGYRTAYEECYSPTDTEVLYCTDGLQAMHELAGRRDKQILIIDEVHTWNLYIEILVALAKERLASDPDFKVVLMSATLEADRLSAYFGGAPVINVSGRTFPVEELPRGSSPRDDIATLLRQGRNVLVFCPGKREIDDMIQSLEDMGLNAEFLPLHGQQSPEEQAKCFRSYGRPRCVVSTNVAETSVTIPGINAVVDLGMERRTQVVNGVEGLYLLPISQASADQRRGRAGRTEPGVYIDWCPERDRPAFSEPEIKRVNLAQLVLTLASFGRDIATFDFFNQPTQASIEEAKAMLVRLGAMTTSGDITPIGRAMSKLPVDVHFARMIVEARRYNADVLAAVLAIAACVQAGGILTKECSRALSKQAQSDLLTQLDYYLAAQSMKRAERDRVGLHVKRYHEAREIWRHLVRMLREPVGDPTLGDRQQVLRACVAGWVDNLYCQRGSRYEGRDGAFRRLDKSSVVSEVPWVIALPFDLDTGDMTYNLLTFVSQVDPAWLAQIAPHLVVTEPSGFKYDSSVGDIVRIMTTYYDGHVTGEHHEPASECPEATLALAKALASGKLAYGQGEHNNVVMAQVAWLRARYLDERLRVDWSAALATRLGTVYSVAQLDTVDLTLNVADYVPAELLGQVLDFMPETIEQDGIIFHFVYKVDGHYVNTAVQIPVGQVAQVRRLPMPRTQERVDRFEAIDAQQTVVATSYSLRALLDKLETMRRDAQKREARAKFAETIAQLSAQCDTIEQTGVHVSDVRNIIRRAQAALDVSWNFSPEKIQQLIRQAQNELERLTGDPTDLLVDDLMNGRFQHPHVGHNQGVLAWLQGVVVRCGPAADGLIELPSMQDYYLERLAGVTGRAAALLVDLRLDSELYVPSDLLPALDLAPESITLKRRGDRMNDYQVTYGYEGPEDPQVAVGVVQVPLSVYESNAGEHGRKSGFPVLPHGIRLVIEVTHENKVVARGEDDADLQGKIDKHKKSRKRGANTPGTDELGLRRHVPLTATAPPPWHVRRR